MRAPRRRSAAAALAAAAALTLTACSSVDGTAVPELSKVRTGTTGDTRTSSTSSTSGVPDSSTPSGTAEVPREFPVSGNPSSPVTVTVVQDMACPACKQFHEVYEDTLDDLSDDPDVQLQYRVIAFLDRMSNDEYSSRAANALYCAWSIGADSRDAEWIDDWTDYQEELFEKQPREGGDGLSDARLVSLADGDFPGLDICVEQQRFGAAVTANTDQQLDDSDFQGTPTVLVNGKRHELSSPQDLKQAVDAAKR
ncbi:DsbA family protein [Gordonia sp. VNK21]|uniref:DsbA family protein n=1 Tax=Gordonia sp. VNK21 TaxID=3382483 RepID=UPI0038D5065E